MFRSESVCSMWTIMSIEAYVAQVSFFLLLSKQVSGKITKAEWYDINLKPQEITNCNVSFWKRLFYAD